MEKTCRKGDGSRRQSFGNALSVRPECDIINEINRKGLQKE